MKPFAKKLGAGLTANVVLLGIVSFFTDMSSEIIFPLLPFFLVFNLGASFFIIGIMEGVAEAVASVLKVFSGYWSDRAGKRKPFISSGYGQSAFTKLFFGLATIWQHVFVLRIVERVGKGLRQPPRDALIAESSPPERKGKAFGFQKAMDTGGAILGPLLAIILVSVFASAYQPIFLIAIIPAFVGFIITLFLKEKKKKKVLKAPLKVGLKQLPIRMRVFVAIATIFALGNFSVFFVMLRTVDLGQTVTMALVFYLIMNITYAFSAIPAGSLSDRIGRVPTIVTGYLLFAVVCFIFAFQTGPILIGIAFLVLGLSNGFAIAVQRAYVCDLAPEEIRATALGTYHMSIGFAKLFSGIMVGFLWTFVGVQFAFIYGVILSVMAATMLYGLPRK
ncbi:MAG: MFS transporter [Methanomassiliicoccales archaeon]|nr:MAG: MFS transporter [Methanomassiliicoccales archaeon]